MKTSKYILYFVLCTFVLFLVSCEPSPLTEKDVFLSEDHVAELTADGTIYTLNDFLDTFMTEEGSFHNDTTPYRDRSYDATHKLYLYSIDTIPTAGPGIYIRGRITTDDYGGNFYKAMVIQQVVNGKQENLRISVDLSSSAGMYQVGQEILIRCNGLCIGRYANQPQLCVPSYNDNIFAMNADQKVGWAPGRIQGSVFRRVTRMLGTPDVSKLQYDTLTLAQLYTEIQFKPAVNAASMDAIRKADGRLIVLKDVCFTGQYENNGSLADCLVGHPDSVGEANVFAPSTQNIGYPQSRVLGDLFTPVQNRIMCSNSEYAKFAYFYLPGADKRGVASCMSFEGTVTGILGWYLDKASELRDEKLDGYEWSVTPRGIKGFGMDDIKMYYQGDKEMPWIPKEYDPNDK